MYNFSIGPVDVEEYSVQLMCTKPQAVMNFETNIYTGIPHFAMVNETRRIMS